MLDEGIKEMVKTRQLDKKWSTIAAGFQIQVNLHISKPEVFGKSKVIDDETRELFIEGIGVFLLAANSNNIKGRLMWDGQPVGMFQVAATTQ